VDKVAKKNNTALLPDKNEDDWSANDGHVARSAASTRDVSQPLSDTELSRSKRLLELAGGEPPRDSELSFAAEDESLRGCIQTLEYVIEKICKLFTTARWTLCITS